MTYNPGQVREVYPYLLRPPGWFIIGGPADADEAQCFVNDYPDVRVLGVEPCREMRRYQLAAGFPGVLLGYALREKRGRVMLREVGRRSSAEWMPGDSPFSGATNLNAVSVTLDELNDTYGPFTDAVLWLDIEGSEYAALSGGLTLLASGRVQLVNIEVLPEREAERAVQCHDLLTGCGFKLAHEWGRMGDHHDRIYVYAGTDLRA